MANFNDRRPILVPTQRSDIGSSTSAVDRGAMSGIVVDLVRCRFLIVRDAVDLHETIVLDSLGGRRAVLTIMDWGVRYRHASSRR